MSYNKQHIPGHPNATERDIAVVIVLWVMLAGICVVAANAWAMELIGR